VNNQYWVTHLSRIDNGENEALVKQVLKALAKPKRTRKRGLGFSPFSKGQRVSGTRKDYGMQEDLEKMRVDEMIKILSRTAHNTEIRMTKRSGDIDAPNDDGLREKKLMCLGMEFVRAVELNRLVQAQQFLDEGFPVNFQHPKDLATGFHRAMWTSATDTIDLLLSTDKIDFLIKDQFGRLAMDIAYRNLRDRGHTRYPIIERKTMEQAKAQGRESEVNIPASRGDHIHWDMI